MSIDAADAKIESPISHSNPKISVVVPTVPRNDHHRVLDYLEKQKFNSFEVKIVNDDGLDICEARNVGILASSGSIVALTDDDCEPPTQWLSNIYEEFSGNDSLACLEGPVLGGLSYSGTRRYIGCNLAFQKTAALDIGGFDSTFDGWRDDTEFGWRLERNYEGNCKFSKDIAMKHPPNPRSNMILRNEIKLRCMYPSKYVKILKPKNVSSRIGHSIISRTPGFICKKYSKL